MNKTCKKCGFTAPEEWFVKTSRKVCFTNKTYKYNRAICPMCEQETRDKRKWSNRFIVKARNAIYNHAKKYNLSPTQFINNYGWEIPLVAHKLQHTYDNSCPYCFNPFNTMGHGLRDITLDVVDPDKPPYLSTNVQAICQTCNSSKGRRNPSDYAFHLQMAKRRQEFLKSAPSQLTLHF